MAELVIASLVGLNVFQLYYWSRVTHKLIDKLMSRNYAEYVSIEKSTDQSDKLPLRIETETDDESVLNELNGMIPN